MQENYLYEYAVIRFLPKVEREEFINVGIILFSKKEKYIKCRYFIDENKIKLFSTEAEIAFIEDNLEALKKICSGHKSGGPIAKLEIHERFRWLTAIRSASIQTSRPHPGFATDLDKTVDDLFEELVL